MSRPGGTWLDEVRRVPFIVKAMRELAREHRCPVDLLPDSLIDDRAAVIQARAESPRGLRLVWSDGLPVGALHPPGQP